ncbi:DNA cytosine methyltransferase [Streptomyces syringium]|uniref:DNA cytosine methyltransferase n=1 Tax=Streptomyces syringium TaxID=76729 RepID=UPI0034042923
MLSLAELEEFAETEVQGEETLAVPAAHAAVVECQAAADLLTAFAQENPGDEEAQNWAFEAVERVSACALAVVDGYEDVAVEYARAAKGERAAVVLGRLDDAGPMTPQRLAALDAETLELLRWYAHPWPVRWLWPPERDTFGRPIRPYVINLFHGPGGWSVGIRDVLGADVDMVGVDLDPGAVATATAAGFQVICASVTDLDPESPGLRHVSGAILSPPCQPFSPAGLRRGRYAAAIDLVVRVIRYAGAAAGFLALVDDDGADAGFAPRSGDSWEEVREHLAELEDPRAGLMAEVVIYPLAMLSRGGSIEWVAVEQSSALPKEIEDALFAEFRQAGWCTVEAVTLDAVDYGAASRRKRRFMTAFRASAPFVDVRPSAPFPQTTFAECVGWPEGRVVNTRGQRGINPATGRPKGGNEFSADKPSPCVTATAYGWKEAKTGERIGQINIARLVGFPGDFPWQHVGRGEGIRNKAQQAADAVCPMVAAAVIGRVLNMWWEAGTRAFAEELYPRTATEALSPDPRLSRRSAQEALPHSQRVA